MQEHELRPFPPSGPSGGFDEAYVAMRMRADALEDRLRLAVELLRESEHRMNRGEDRVWWDEYDRLLDSLPEDMR